MSDGRVRRVGSWSGFLLDRPSPDQPAPRPPEGRTPWGLGEILAILLLTALGWGIVILVVHFVARGVIAGPEGTPSIRALLILTAVLYAILYLVILAVIGRAGGWHSIGYRRPGLGSILGVVAFLPVWYAILAAVSAATIAVINHGQPIPSNVTELFPGGLRGVSRGDIALAFVVAAGIAPLVEETFFRGVLYQWLRGYTGVAPAVLISAFIFGGAHLLKLLLPVLFVMGCVLALIFQRTRTLFASMLLHSINNALAIVALIVGFSH